MSENQWRKEFNAWWDNNRVETHKVKNIQGFASKVWHAAIKSVAGATDSATGFYPVDGGSIPPRQANPTESDANGCAEVQA